MNETNRTAVAPDPATISDPAISVQSGEVRETSDPLTSGEWKLTVEEFTFSGCHHNAGGTD